MANRQDLHEIRSIIDHLLGQRAWDVTLGIGSFLTIEFGEVLPPKKANQKVHGIWHLWLYGCAWRLDRASKNTLAGSEDARETLGSAIRYLEGRMLQSVKLFLPTLDAVFLFEENFCLRTFVVISEDMDQWLLYTPTGHVLTVGPGGEWSYIQSSSHS